MTDNDEPLEPIAVEAPETADSTASQPAANTAPAAGVSRGPVSAGAAVAVAIAMIVAAIAGYAITSAARTSKSFNGATGAPNSPRTPATRPGNPGSTPTDPGQRALTSVVVQQQDVTSAYTVGLINNGATLTEPTLDLCNADYASEHLRTGRLQVAEVSGDGTPVMSTEAVLYRNEAATVQAFSELQRVARSCPKRAVPSPNGGDTLQTTINGPADRTWPNTPGVERLAYDFNTVDSSGQRSHFVTAYLRRGRAFLGVYFSQPDGAQPPVAGQTSVEGIVQLFEKRLAALPASVVNASR